MKKVYSLLGLAAIAAMSFTACQKDVLPVEESAGTHTVVFTANLNETKTALGTDASTWTAEDKANFAVYEYYTTTTDGVTNTSAKKHSSIDVVFDNDENPTVATVTASFKDLSDGQTFDGYVAVVAGNISNSGNPIVLTEQNPTTASYDPNADILVSNKVTETEAPTDCAFSFARVVSINKMTLKNLVAGEKISSVTITADSKNFVSRYVVNTNSYIGDSYAIECKYDNATVGTDGTFDVYFTSTPAETILTLTIVTDQNLYSKTFTKSITFAANDLHTFGVNMAGCGEAVSAGTTYTLVESTSDLRNGGTYIIAAAGDNNYAMGALGSTSNNRLQVEITKNADNTIVVNNTTAVVPVQIEKDDNNKYTIANTENGYFLCHPSVSKNYLQETENFLDDENEIDTTTEWTISVANGVATITNVAANTYKIKFNASNGIFSCYTTTQTDIALYVDKTTGEENTEETSIANTLETAYTTSEATALVDAGQDLTTKVYVTGTVKSVNYNYLSSGNISITVSDGTKDFVYYQCYAGIDGENLTNFTTKAIIPGDVVVAYGELTKYNSTYEFKKNCYVVDITEATVTSLTWTPETTTYELDDTFNLDGTATAMINGVSYDVIDYVTVSEEPDMETSGEKTVTVSLRGKTATAKITVGSTSTSIANTAETAYTASEAIALIDAGKDLTTKVYVKGTVKSVVYTYLASSGNINITVTDGTKDFLYYMCYADENLTKFTSKPIIPGDVVVAYGELTKYNSTYEFKKECYVVSNTEGTISSLTWTGNTTSFTQDDEFTLNGTVTAVIGGESYDVTEYATVTTAPNMTTTGTKTAVVTVRNTTASISITVNAKSSNAKTASFDLAYTATDSKSADWSLTAADATITWSKGTNSYTPSPNKEGSVRMYNGTTMTISVSGDYKITKVVFTALSATYSASNLKYGDDAIADSWELDTPVSSAVLTATANARFSKIVVYYE